MNVKWNLCFNKAIAIWSLINQMNQQIYIYFYVMECPIATQQQQMRLDEQQINKQLNQIEQQDELTHIRWLISKNINKSSFTPKKEEPISQWDWGSDREQITFYRKSNILSMIRSKNNQKVNRYAHMLSANQSKQYRLPAESQSNSSQIIDQSFQKQCEVAVSPTKINLKLPFPQILQHSSSVDSPQQRQSSLPLIKKLNFLRSIEHKKQRNQLEQSTYPLILQQQSSITWKKQDKQSSDSYRKGKMMGTTRRQMKGISYFIQRPRNSLENNRLKECITFMK